MVAVSLGIPFAEEIDHPVEYANAEELLLSYLTRCVFRSAMLGNRTAASRKSKTVDGPKRRVISCGPGCKPFLSNSTSSEGGVVWGSEVLSS